MFIAKFRYGLNGMYFYVTSSAINVDSEKECREQVIEQHKNLGIKVVIEDIIEML